MFSVSLVIGNTLYTMTILIPAVRSIYNCLDLLLAPTHYCAAPCNLSPLNQVTGAIFICLTRAPSASLGRRAVVSADLPSSITEASLTKAKIHYFRSLLVSSHNVSGGQCLMQLPRGLHSKIPPFYQSGSPPVPCPTHSTH